MPQGKTYTYADAGVSIDAGNTFVKTIAPFVKRTARKGSDAVIGGFGAFFDLAAAGFEEPPLLVAATDGVGTKLRLAIETQRNETVGIDVVAMCVNDLVVQGAIPLIFLDYFATARLNPAVAATVVKGIAKGCEIAGCALVGGETAEMPSMYQDDDYDLAGFAVGAVERGKQITGDKVIAGDVILGLASSGFHSNGYSLIRKLIHDHNIHLGAPAPFQPKRRLSQVLLEPTRIYVKSLLPELRRIKALAHITGGGLLENIPRCLPNEAHAATYAGDFFEREPGKPYQSLRAIIDAGSWTLPPAFNWIQKLGQISTTEMARTFNCGIGMVVIVSVEDAGAVAECLSKAGERVFRIGTVEEGSPGCTVKGPAGTWNSEDEWTAVDHA